MYPPLVVAADDVQLAVDAQRYGPLANETMTWRGELRGRSREEARLHAEQLPCTEVGRAAEARTPLSRDKPA